MIISNEELFVLTIEDLRKKLKDSSTYALLRACGLCRQLLLDGSPLYALANKNYKLKITFQVSESALERTKLEANFVLFVGPITSVNDLKEFKIEKFLKIKVFAFKGQKYSVQDMIKAAANIMGGVHSTGLEELWDHDNALTHMSLITVCQAILSGLEPLELAIKAQLNS